MDHHQPDECTVGVLDEPPITHLGQVPKPLEREKGMFDFGSDFRFAPMSGFVGLAQRSVPVGAFVGEILRPGRQLLETLSLFLAPIGAVSMEAGFISKEEIRDFMAVMHVGCGHTRVMNNPRLAVRTNVNLHPEMPLILTFPLKMKKRKKPFEPAFATVEERF
jgi:hypothetical protein